MEWLSALIISLSTLIVSKALDLWAQSVSYRREFHKFRKQRIYEEIEELRNVIGNMYELASKWDSFEDKKNPYSELRSTVDLMLGKINKYPTISIAARDMIHKCQLVISAERSYKDVESLKEGLHNANKEFVQVCDHYLEKL
jgi:hypothetical protein